MPYWEKARYNEKGKYREGVGDSYTARVLACGHTVERPPDILKPRRKWWCCGGYQVAGKAKAAATKEATMDTQTDEGLERASRRKKLADMTPDELMARMVTQGYRDRPDWALHLQTVKNARAQIRRITGLDNDQIEAWAKSGAHYDVYISNNPPKEVPTMSEATTNGSENEIAARLREAVEAIDNAVVTDAPNGRYYTVKRDGKTLGYVSGKTRKFRIDTSMTKGEKKQLIVTSEEQIPAAVELLASQKVPVEPEAVEA